MSSSRGAENVLNARLILRTIRSNTFHRGIAAIDFYAFLFVGGDAPVTSTLDCACKRGSSEVLFRICSRRILKRDAMGIHGMLFYDLEYKKQYCPTRHDKEAVNSNGSLLR